MVAFWWQNPLYRCGGNRCFSRLARSGGNDGGSTVITVREDRAT